MSNHIRELYKCPKCALVIEIAAACSCTEPCLRCCGEKLHPLPVNTTGELNEKHLPVVTLDEKGIHVRVGSVEHPMMTAHYIMWIEVSSGSNVMRKYLKPGEEPEAFFPVAKMHCSCNSNIIVREYCNLHGLWQTEINKN